MSDNDPKGIYATLAQRLQYAATSSLQAQKADLNIQPPRASVDPVTGARFYDTAPTPFKRLMGSPLVQAGPYATGPGQPPLRLVLSGWGDPRSVDYGARVDQGRRHHGLDFKADYGETVVASADGEVVFVGYESRDRGNVSIPFCTENPVNGNVLDADGRTVALGFRGTGQETQVAHGGIMVLIRHDGDFAGYESGYMHLSAVTAKLGRILEGQPIGKVGTTGGDYGLIKSGTHLHWMVWSLASGNPVAVRPTFLVPNFWPGHDGSSTPAKNQSLINLQLPQKLGLATVAAAAANQVQVMDRATDQQNQTGADHKRFQADHREAVAHRINSQQTQLYAAIAQFQGESPTVVAPMLFNFETGLWNDGVVQVSADAVAQVRTNAGTLIGPNTVALVRTNAGTLIGPA